MDKQTSTAQTAWKNILFAAIGVGAVSSVLLALSVLTLHTESGSIVATIMLSGSLGLVTSALLYRLLEGKLTKSLQITASAFNFVAFFVGILFLTLSWVTTIT